MLGSCHIAVVLPAPAKRELVASGGLAARQQEDHPWAWSQLGCVGIQTCHHWASGSGRIAQSCPAVVAGLVAVVAPVAVVVTADSGRPEVAAHDLAAVNR